MFAGAHLVDNLREYLFTATAFAGYQYRHISRCHLAGNIYSTVKQRRIANNTEPLFNILCIHLFNFQLAVFSWQFGLPKI
ncbi:hypothetical protein D3C72_1895030 [compost metagenome]